MKAISRFILLLIALVSATVEAASLGTLTPKSKFGQPLLAEVEVLLDGLPAEDYQAALASPAVHTATEVDYTGFHQGVISEIVPIGGDKFAVRLSTTEKLKEPVFDFVLELKWRGGRVQRLYTLLPEFISTTAAATTAPVAHQYSATNEANTPAVPAKTTAVGEAGVTHQQLRHNQGAPLTPVEAGSYRVQTGDSLWLIASRMSSAYGTLAHRIDMLMMANLSLIKSNTPMGIHPGDTLTIPNIGEAVVPGNLLDLAAPEAKPTPAKDEPFYKQAAAKEALLARVRGRQLIRLAAQAGRFIEPAQPSVSAEPVATNLVQQRVEELDRRDIDLENRLAALDEKIERVLSDEGERRSAPVVTQTLAEEASRSWMWWLIITVVVILMAFLGVSLRVYLQRRREMEQDSHEDADYWEQESISEYRSVYREAESAAEPDDIPLIDEGFNLSGNASDLVPAMDEDIKVDDIESIEPVEQARVKVRDPDLDDMQTIDAALGSSNDASDAPAMNQLASDEAASSEEDDSEDIEFTFTDVHQRLDADISEPELDKILEPEQDEEALAFQLPEIEAPRKPEYVPEGSSEPSDDEEIEIDAWPKWDEVSAVDLVANERDEFDLEFDINDTANASDSFVGEGAAEQDDEASLDENEAEAIELSAPKSTAVFDETIQLNTPLMPSADSVAVVAQDQGEVDMAVAEPQEIVEPLKRMLLAGPQKQPKVKAASASATSSPFETMLLGNNGDKNRALFYIEINDLDDIENRIGPLDAEQVAQHLGVKIRDYVGLQGLNDQLMRLRDSTYLYVGDYKQEAELTEYGEAIALMVSGTEFLSNGVDVGLTVSIGIVPIGPHFETVNEYLICAKKTVDEARLLAQEGLEIPQVALFSAPVDMLEQDEALIAKVTEYIRDEQFDIVFQPLINLTGKCEYLFSAKAEIGHDVDLTKLPDHFLASAFSSTASVALDKYAIRQSLEQVIHLHSQRQEAVVMVRVSNNSIHDPAFITWLKKLVVGHEHYARQVVLCLDEHLIAVQRVACWSFCNSLKSSGYQIGVNSFGATKDSLDHAMELGARIVRFDNDKVNLAIKTSEGIEHLSRLAVACKERGIETITYTFNSTAIPSIWQFNIDAIRSNYILVPDRSNNFEISGT